MKEYIYLIMALLTFNAVTKLFYLAKDIRPALSTKTVLCLNVVECFLLIAWGICVIK